MLPEDTAGTTQVKPEIDGLLMERALRRQMRQGRQGLFVTPHGFAGRRALHGLGPRLPAIPEGLVPPLAAHGMVGQALDLVGEAVTGERFQGLDDLRMQRPSALLQETAISHLVREGMLEGVCAYGS